MRRERAPNGAQPRDGIGGWRGVEFQATVALAALLTPLNSTILAIGLPEIRAYFDTGVGATALLISAYLVAVATMQPVAGRLGDAFGCVRMMAAGLVLLAGISIALGLAWSFPFLVLMRGVQGAVTALVLPNAIAVLRKRTPPQRLGTALGMNGAALSAAAALGPVLGGLVLLAGEWRLLFFINVPLSLIALALLLRVQQDQGQGRASLRIDLPSLAALVLVFSSVVLIGSATRVEHPAFLIAGVSLAPLTLAAYWLRSRRGGSVVDFTFFRARNFSAAASSQGLLNFVMYSALVAFPLYLVDLRGESEQIVSLALFSLLAASIVVSPLGGMLADRLGWRPLVVTGGLAALAGTVILALLFESPALFVIVASLVLVGIGLGVSGPARSAAALEAWPPGVAGSASGTFAMMRYAGAIAGAAVIAALLGADPEESAFRLLMLTLTVIAALNVAVSFAIHDQPRGARATDQPSTATPDRL